MLIHPDLSNATTDPDALRASVPIVLADDYLYSTLVRRVSRRASLNPAPVNAAYIHSAYGRLGAELASRGTRVDAPA